MGVFHYSFLQECAINCSTSTDSTECHQEKYLAWRRNGMKKCDPSDPLPADTKKQDSHDGGGDPSITSFDLISDLTLQKWPAGLLGACLVKGTKAYM